MAKVSCLFTRLSKVYFRLSINKDVGPRQSRKEGYKKGRKEKKRGEGKQE